MNADILRTEAAVCLDNAALQLYRACGKLERMGENNQAATVRLTTAAVRRMRDTLLQQKGGVNTAPHE